MSGTRPMPTEGRTGQQRLGTDSWSRQQRDEFLSQTNTPPETLAQLAGDTDWVVRRYVGLDVNTPPETLTHLVEDEVGYVRFAVASNPSAPSEALVRLAVDANEGVRERVAQNLNTPPETLARLAGDEDYVTRYAVAKNPNTPAEALTQLSVDENSGVRIGVGENPMATLELLKCVYEQAVQSDTLEEEFVCSIIQRNALGSTELCALLAIYGEAIAQTIVNSTTIEPGSVLDRQLASFGFVATPAKTNIVKLLNPTDPAANTALGVSYG